MEGQAVTKEAEHTVTLMESMITHCDMLGVEKSKTVYNNRNKSTRDIDVINKHFAVANEVAVIKADESIDEEGFKRAVYEKRHPKIRKMLRKNNDIW